MTPERGNRENLKGGDDMAKNKKPVKKGTKLGNVKPLARTRFAKVPVIRAPRKWR
jgi:hypothetical protein